jgi:hypothetical protein
VLIVIGRHLALPPVEVWLPLPYRNRVWIEDRSIQPL